MKDLVLALLSLEREYVNGLDFYTFVDEFDGRHYKNVLNYINYLLFLINEDFSQKFSFMVWGKAPDWPLHFYSSRTATA